MRYPGCYHPRPPVSTKSERASDRRLLGWGEASGLIAGCNDGATSARPGNTPGCRGRFRTRRDGTGGRKWRGVGGLTELRVGRGKVRGRAEGNVEHLIHRLHRHEGDAVAHLASELVQILEVASRQKDGRNASTV